MSEKMSNAPVYYALAQTTFNTIGAMSKYVNEVQDILRREGYTLFDHNQITQLEISPKQEKDDDVAKVGKSEYWLITQPDRTSGFVLSASRIVFHTTNYETHSTFIQELMLGLKAVHKAAELDHIRRVGLRYLNAILPRKGEAIDQYLDPGLHGVSFHSELRYALNESVFSTESGPLVKQGTLISRIYNIYSQLGFPPDLVIRNLALMPKFVTEAPLRHAVLDIDHFAEGRMPLDTNQLAEQLSNLHATIKIMFEKATTKHARSTWA